ncbi:MAG: hypothetical protein Q4G58_02735 [bacterium]|nr:hypothetical protein [bacterium]
MKIIFDNEEWNVEDSSKNIVELAKEHEIYIPAPCYYKKIENGCCNCCLILVDGTMARACSTLPADGMNITFNTSDLLAKRERNLTCYALGIPTELETGHAHDHAHHDHDHDHDSCGDDCSCGDNGCGDDCSCGGNCGCGSH